MDSFPDFIRSLLLQHTVTWACASMALTYLCWVVLDRLAQVRANARFWRGLRMMLRLYQPAWQYSVAMLFWQILLVGSAVSTLMACKTLSAEDARIVLTLTVWVGTGMTLYAHRRLPSGEDPTHRVMTKSQAKVFYAAWPVVYVVYMGILIVGLISVLWQTLVSALGKSQR